jgi:uncharacterized protein YbbC (DUF1343 family)
MNGFQANKARTGSTVLFGDNFSMLAGQTIGFIGNHTSLLGDGTPTVRALISQSKVTVKRLFSPEHGAFGRHDENVEDDVDPLTGLQIVSLYGEHRKPTVEMLSDLDLLVFELQDVGARFYTYSATLLLAIDAAYEAGKKVVVLDRPNPINGIDTDGPIADENAISFTAAHTIPIRHGLTLGELALLYADEKGYKDTLDVVACDGWPRSQWFDSTNITWVNPSPAMRSLAAATLYPGVCLLEQTNVSVGRGTGTPFELVGAPYLDAKSMALAMNDHKIPGVDVEEVSFKPSVSKFAGETCHGIRILIVDRTALRSVYFGLALLTTLRDLYGDAFELAKAETLLANEKTYNAICNGKQPTEIAKSWRDGLLKWNRRVRSHLIYTG